MKVLNTHQHRLSLYYSIFLLFLQPFESLLSKGTLFWVVGSLCGFYPRQESYPAYQERILAWSLMTTPTYFNYFSLTIFIDEAVCSSANWKLTRRAFLCGEKCQTHPRDPFPPLIHYNCKDFMPIYGHSKQELCDLFSRILHLHIGCVRKNVKYWERVESPVICNAKFFLTQVAKSKQPAIISRSNDYHVALKWWAVKA